jgi:hypothetical protein
MFRIFALLAMVLTLTTLTFADVPPSPNVKNAPRSPNKGSGVIELDNLQFGVGRSLNNPVGKESDREGGSPSVSQIHATPPVSAAVTPAVMIPTVTEPCKVPNPPHSCNSLLSRSTD